MISILLYMSQIVCKPFVCSVFVVVVSEQGSRFTPSLMVLKMYAKCVGAEDVQQV